MKLNYQNQASLIRTREQQIADFIGYHGFTRISDIFIIPKNVHNTRSYIKKHIVRTDHLRYPINVKIEERDYGLQDYYIRSFGEDFNLILFRWYEAWEKPIKIYSLGPGIYKNKEVSNLMLAQVFDAPNQLSDLQVKLLNCPSPFEELKSSLSKEFEVDCLRVWGV